MEAIRGATTVGPHDVGGLREQVRARRRAVSVPLLVTGAAITAVSVRDLLFTYVAGRTAPGHPIEAGFLFRQPASLFFWLLMPLAFLTVWWSRRRLRNDRGVGITRPSLAAAGVTAVLLVIPYYFLVIIFNAPFLAFALGLLVIGLAERTTAVWAWALGVGIVGGVEVFHWFTNSLPANLYFDEAHDLILVGLAVLTVVAGLVAWRRENRTLAA